MYHPHLNALFLTFQGYDQNQWCLHIAMPKHVKHVFMNQGKKSIGSFIAA